MPSKSGAMSQEALMIMKVSKLVYPNRAIPVRQKNMGTKTATEYRRNS
jgi:hypothetical protein